jgi:hypothetical protein
MTNLIKLDHNKSFTEGDLLFIDGKSYNFGDIITIFKDEKIYKEENSGIEFSQTHFEDKLGYIDDNHTFIIGGNIDDLSDQFFYSDELDIDNFEEFIKGLSRISTKPFKIATIAWEENGIGVYYIKYDKTFQSVRLGFDDWEDTDLFKEVAKENKFDINSDDFYDDDEDHENGSSPCHQVCDKLYNQLISDPELLSPDWY